MKKLEPQQNRPRSVGKGDPNITMTVRAGISSNHGLFVGHVRFYKSTVRYQTAEL
jgi:hypothetical protein